MPFTWCGRGEEEASVALSLELLGSQILNALEVASLGALSAMARRKSTAAGKSWVLMHSMAGDWGALHELLSLRTHVAAGFQCHQSLRSRHRMG
jgi:hypothetical protein